MAQIRVKDLTFCYDGGIDNIFEDVSFSIDTDWRLGFIGRNGKGKTTFLNLLLGKYRYQGTIDAPSGFRYFPYLVTERQMGMEAWEFIDELEEGCELWQAARELADLGETDEILYRPFGSLSPGERTKILLAVLFAGNGGFFLIDEPTSHLDLEAREAVQTYLASKKGFILVSHDRELLDACTDHCLVLNRRTIEVMTGSFSVWWENKTRKDQFAASENEKHLKEIRKLKEASARAAGWADKNERTKIGYDPIKEHDRGNGSRSYIGAKTKKMQSRVKQMEKRIGREIREKEGLLKDLEVPADLKLTKLSHHKSVLVEARDYSIRYRDAGRPVFEGLGFSIEKGDRAALSGRNGCGKSTLIRAILGKNGQGSKDYSRQEKISRSRQEKYGRHFFQSLVHEKAPRAFVVSVYETAEAPYAPGSSRRAGWSSLRSSGRSLRHAPQTAWWAGIPAEAFRSASWKTHRYN